MSKFAKVIVNISHESVDRPFEYIVPGEIEDKLRIGSPVTVPFGRSDKLTDAFVIGLSDKADYDISKLKYISAIREKDLSLESSLIELAAFIKENYGSTMNQALKTVMPVKKSKRPVVNKYIKINVSKDEAYELIEKYSKKNSKAKVRLLTELISVNILPWDIVRDRLNISPQTLKALERDGVIIIDVKEDLRDALNLHAEIGYNIVLNDEQQSILDSVWNRYLNGDSRPSLIRGVTGSGKTEVYIGLIEKFLAQGRQAIVLIPEIALTYQTVLRFYRKFGARISVINSRLTPAERHDQFEKAKRGEVDIIIGPRSALFAPFKNIGIIIIDEEHENTYKNENAPRYHSREVAIKRAELSGGIVVLGSATPSVASYFKAKRNEFMLYEMENRASGAQLPSVEIVDLRRELDEGNRSIISRKLDTLIRDRLMRKEQIILFINRRGYSSFVSCRSCGKALKCPHCDVSLKYHNNGRLVCHYCGFEMPMVRNCPECGSKYIGTFGTGTQKVEEELRRLYPEARILRMDFDTTREKNAHTKILETFGNGDADILVGTQMIVKGHDFANVTLVGILAADISLNASDYMAAERTFDLLTQCAGRAGRGEKAGEVIIQTYLPDNYAVKTGAAQDYKGFYEQEMHYRNLLGYPPSKNMLAIQFSCEDDDHLIVFCNMISEKLDKILSDTVIKIGPSQAPISKINDLYRRIIYMKSADYELLTSYKDFVESFLDEHPDKSILVTFDFSLIS